MRCVRVSQTHHRLPSSSSIHINYNLKIGYNQNNFRNVHNYRKQIFQNNKFEEYNHNRYQNNKRFFLQNRYNFRSFHSTRVIQKTPWEILEIKEDANDQEIKKAYIAMSRKYHPDVSKEENAADKFSEVVKAYNILKDPEKREKAKVVEFDDFDYRGDFDSSGEISIEDLFSNQRNELGVNHLEVIRRAWKIRKKKDKKKKQLEEEMKMEINEFLQKPIFTSINIKSEFPTTSFLKETGTEFVKEDAGLELQNLSINKLFTLGFVTSNHKSITNGANYEWQNRLGTPISTATLELQKPSSVMFPSKAILNVLIDDKSIGSIESFYYPHFPFLSLSKIFDNNHAEVAKVSRLHLLGSRYSITKNSQQDSSLNSPKSTFASRKLRPLFFKEYLLNYSETSLHPAFLMYLTAFSYQLDVSIFSVMTWIKKTVVNVAKRLKNGFAKHMEEIKKEEMEEEKEREKEKKEREREKEKEIEKERKKRVREQRDAEELEKKKRKEKRK